MKRMLNEITSINAVIQYAADYPDSRTAKVLKKLAVAESLKNDSPPVVSETNVI